MKIPGGLKKMLASNKDETLVVHIFGCGIKAAYFKRMGISLVLQDWAIAYHPDILKTPDNEIVNFLVTFVQKNSIKTKEVILSLADIDGVVIKETVAQALGETEEAGGAIKFQLAEDIKFDANIAQVGWRLLSEIKDKDGTRQNRVLALVVDRNLISKFVALIELCKLNIGVITSYRFHWETI